MTDKPKPEIATDEEISEMKRGRLAGCEDPCVEVLALFARIDSDRLARQEDGELIKEMVEALKGLVEWGEGRWDAEVKHRPLVNVHRRTLDGTWNRVINHLRETRDAAIAKAEKRGGGK